MAGTTPESGDRIMSKRLKKDIGERLKQVREKLYLSQKQMAADLLIVRSTLSRIERGELFPGIDVLNILVEKKGVSLTWLIGGRGGMFDPSLKVSHEVLEFVAQNEDVVELLSLMLKVPGLRYSVMGHFHSFKQDNPQVVADTVKESNGE
jgi:transcriptional regulator with XRE-family HTH domain